MKNFDPKVFGKVVVLMGGISNEREISLLSGQRVLEALLEQKIDAIGIDVNPQTIITELQKIKPDRAFIALHGFDGEDGKIQSLLEILNIKYASSGICASALTMHKHYANAFWKIQGLPVLPFVILNSEKDFGLIKSMSLPLAIKPTNSGSSCGVTKLTDFSKLKEAYDFAKKNTTDTVMVEPWIEGREFTVGILGEKTLPVIEIKPTLEFYDYEAKYLSDETGYIFPEDLSEKDVATLNEISKKAFELAGCRGFGRADFIQDKAGNFWLLEMNTIPGMTTHSLVPKACQKIGVSFGQMLIKVLEFTL
jgi:D-alanine-D-alanine ligase